MRMVTGHKAKTKLSRPNKKASVGEDIIGAGGEKSLACLVPSSDPKSKRQPGVLKGKLHVGPEFFEALPVSELRGWG